jgi:hypothetical protein
VDWMVLRASGYMRALSFASDRRFAFGR